MEVRYPMSAFTLDAIREAAEAKYGSTDIEVDGVTVRLVNALRLSKEKRAELQAIQTELTDNENADQEELFCRAIRTVAEDVRLADVLLTAVNGDLAILAEIFEQYGKGTQAGEA